jgi:uncharacterized damage-inducible protein DinB
MNRNILQLFCASALLCALSLPALAQTAAPKPADKRSPAIREQEMNWQRAKKWTLDYLEAMPENAMSFKPTPEVRSFAEQMLHLSFWNFGLVEGLGGKPNPYGKKQEELEKRADMQSKAAVRKVVEESYDNVIGVVGKLEAAQLLEPVKFFNSQMTRMNILSIALDHQTHHRGNTTIYLRLKGVTPPPEP